MCTGDIRVSKFTYKYDRGMKSDEEKWEFSREEVSVDRHSKESNYRFVVGESPLSCENSTYFQ